MAFEYYSPRIPDAVREAGARRRVEMYLSEAGHRAALLKRLGFSREQATRRIVGPLEEGFSVTGRPEFLDQIPKAIDDVYGKRTSQA